ncbi:MAG: response regulator transcription factor [Rhodothermia bacterium]
MTLEPQTIAVVDDDDGVRKALARLLRAHGYEVKGYSSADDFLTNGADDAGCMVLDVQMPGLDGLALQEEMQARDIRLPIIFITAHGDVPKSVRAMKRGAVDFLQKPFDEIDLLRAISIAIERGDELREHQAERSAIEGRVQRLTRREYEVFVRVIKGTLNKRIATELGVTEKTIKAHRARVMHKMEATSLAHLVRMAERVGL